MLDCESLESYDEKHINVKKLDLKVNNTRSPVLTRLFKVFVRHSFRSYVLLSTAQCILILPLLHKVNTTALAANTTALVV